MRSGTSGFGVKEMQGCQDCGYGGSLGFGGFRLPSKFIFGQVEMRWITRVVLFIMIVGVIKLEF